MQSTRPLRLLLLPFLALSLLCGPVWATWSIVAVDPRTGEVGVASATCLANFNLKRGTPVVWVGAGAGAAQSLVDNTGGNRRIIRDGLRDGQTPQEILDELVFGAGTQPGQRQYGVASFAGPAVTYTGGAAGLAATGVAGTVDGIHYAIQGNVLTDDAVVFAAEAAFVASKSDLGERLLEAMEAARVLGGDGRCSCAPNDPTGCGAPPESFEFSAYVAYLIVARIGDENDEVCDFTGCARGDYYLDINVVGNQNNIDPVFRLRNGHNQWSDSLVGRPDHILSRVLPSAESLPADGTTAMEVTVELVDRDGVPLASGGATIEVAPASNGSEGPGLVEIGPVMDLGDGSYRFELVAGESEGLARLAIVADDGEVRARLYPDLEVRLDPQAPLHAGFDAVSSAAGVHVPLTVNEPASPGGYYLLLASASGTVPGQDLGFAQLLLNPDDLFFRSAANANNARFVDTFGFLDGAGRAEAAFDAPPGLLNNLVGTRFDWAALVFDGGFRATEPVGFDVNP